MDVRCRCVWEAWLYGDCMWRGCSECPYRGCIRSWSPLGGLQQKHQGQSVWGVRSPAFGMSTALNYVETANVVMSMRKVGWHTVSMLFPTPYFDRNVGHLSRSVTAPPAPTICIKDIDGTQIWGRIVAFLPRIPVRPLLNPEEGMRWNKSTKYALHIFSRAG